MPTVIPSLNKIKMAKPKVKSEFVKNLDKVPPCICRWHAYERTEDGVRLLTNTELAKKSGLAKRMVQRLSAKATWEGVKVEVVGAFLKGCDADLFDLAWYLAFLDEFAGNEFQFVQDTRQRRTVYKAMQWNQASK